MALAAPNFYLRGQVTAHPAAQRALAHSFVRRSIDARAQRPTDVEAQRRIDVMQPRGRAVRRSRRVGVRLLARMGVHAGLGADAS